MKSRYLAAITDKPWWLAGGIPRSACMVAYQPKGASDYATSKVNLANPSTYNATDGAAYPTWNATNGWMFNSATSQYLITGFSGVTRTTSVIIAFSNVSSSTGALFGAYYANTNCHYVIQPHHTEPGCRYWNSVAPLVTSVISSGVLAISGNTAYKNGTADGTMTLTPTSSTSTPIWFIGGYNNLNNLGAPLSCYIQSFAYYSTTLTAAQVAALTVAMNAL